MENTLTFNRENQERIKAVGESFGPGSKSLVKPGRVLIGEGRLLKQSPSHKKPQTKVFFLFNDVIVYGSILLGGRMYKKQKVIPLETIKLEDVADTAAVKNQWLVRTPRKSFFVVAPNETEKRLWMQNIEEAQAGLLQQGLTACSEYAVSWMPDSASDICLICEAKFTATNRRHHCRRCGVLVCHKCCKEKAVIGHISATKKQRVCRHCSSRSPEEARRSPEEARRSRFHSMGDALAESSEDEEQDEELYLQPSSWLDSRMGTWSNIGAYMTMHPAQK